MPVLRSHLWAAELALQDGPEVLRHPMPALTGLVPLQVYINNQLVMHLCRVLVEPLMEVGIWPMLF